MSSWGAAARPRIRLGYRQIKPAGTFVKKELPATVVSAYYEMPSKYPKENYRKWVRLFLEGVDCWLIFFCEKDLVPFIEDCRKAYPEKTTIVILPRERWVANQDFPPTFWQEQHAVDPEKGIHSPDLYKVWFEKKEFVKRAMELNPYNHTDFVWTDAGFCRSEGFAALIRQYPNADRIPTNKFLMLNVGEFTEKDNDIVNVNGVPIRGGGHGKMRIGGTLLAASRDSWLKYSEAYDSILNRYVEAKLFCGKDQSIMATLVLENTDLISLVEPKAIGPELWFYLGLWLGCSEKLYGVLNDTTRQGQKKTYDELKAIA